MIQTLLEHAVLKLQRNTYLLLIMFLAPALNFLAGVGIDLYAPSMPAIADQFHISIALVKNTISIMMLGFALCSLIAGVLIDTFGRKRVIIVALVIYIAISLAAARATTLDQLMVIRFLQGMMTSVIAIGSRVLINDHFSGKDYLIAMLYGSVAFSLGPILGPFIGGYLQYHFGWQANFYAYAGVALILFLAVWLILQESMDRSFKRTMKQRLKAYKDILASRAFLAGITLLGFVVIQQMLYPTVGPFLVQHKLGYSAIVYGNTALLIGLCYFVGTLLNRGLLKYFMPKRLISIGFTLLTSSLILQMGVYFYFPMSLPVLLIPIGLIALGLGFIFSNVLSLCLRQFPYHSGVASALQTFALMAIGSLGIFIVSHFPINQLYHLFFIYLVVIGLQLVLYFIFMRHVQNEP
jgi:MFS family permease